MGILSTLGDAAENVGEMLGIGNKEEEEKQPEVGGEINTSALDQPQVAYNTEPAAVETKTYTVQSGDTLSEISQRYYGDSGSYMKIFEANRDKLSDPDKISVGQELTIPD